MSTKNRKEEGREWINLGQPLNIISARNGHGHHTHWPTIYGSHHQYHTLSPQNQCNAWMEMMSKEEQNHKKIGRYENEWWVGSLLILLYCLLICDVCIYDWMHCWHCHLIFSFSQRKKEVIVRCQNNRLMASPSLLGRSAGTTAINFLLSNGLHISLFQSPLSNFIGSSPF